MPVEEAKVKVCVSEHNLVEVNIGGNIRGLHPDAAEVLASKLVQAASTARENQRLVFPICALLTGVELTRAQADQIMVMVESRIRR